MDRQTGAATTADNRSDAGMVPDRPLRDPLLPPPAGTLNDAVSYGVLVEPASVAPGEACWRAVNVHHLTPDENGGRHHLYLDMWEPTAEGKSQRVDRGRFLVSWSGGEEIVTADKGPNEPATNFPLWKGQVCTVRALGVAGQELSSDLVTGIHTSHDDEAPGNTLFHHSFHVAFHRLTQPEQGPGPAGKPLSHYVLFGPAEQPATGVHLLLAQDYLLAFGSAFGFSPTEASAAARVTIVADTDTVEADVEAQLVAAGTQVQRISGTLQDMARLLHERVNSGQPF